MANEVINYRYYHWGPLLYSSKVTPERLTKISEICKKTINLKTFKDAQHLTLFQKSPQVPHLEIFNVLKPYFQSYAKAHTHDWDFRPLPRLTLGSAWVNSMEAGDFNPPHNHTGVLSFVVYLKVPDELKKENEKSTLQSMVGPGAIEFRISEFKVHGAMSRDMLSFFPEEGEIFIFPTHLEHWVFPFKSKVTRVSLSGNLVEKK